MCSDVVNRLRANTASQLKRPQSAIPSNYSHITPTYVARTLEKKIGAESVHNFIERKAEQQTKISNLLSSFLRNSFYAFSLYRKCDAVQQRHTCAMIS